MTLNPVPQGKVSKHGHSLIHSGVWLEDRETEAQRNNLPFGCSERGTHRTHASPMTRVPSGCVPGRGRRAASPAVGALSGQEAGP